MNNDTGTLLREAREQRGLTQMQLAQLANRVQPSISRIECGRHSPTVRNLEHLFGAMGLELCLFFSERREV